jgi:hypothetical protein
VFGNSGLYILTQKREVWAGEVFEMWAVGPGLAAALAASHRSAGKELTVLATPVMLDTVPQRATLAVVQRK